MTIRRRDDIEALEGMDLAQLARRGGSSALYTLLVIGAVVLALGVSMAVRHEWDFSRGQTNSLSPQTREMLSRLTADVHLYPLWTDTDRTRTAREGYYRLLGLYRRASDRVKVTFIDPVSQPGRVRDLGLQTSEQPRSLDGITVVVRGNRRLTFEGTMEEDVTNAILEAGSNRRRVVGFLRGYGERDPASSAESGLAGLATALRGEYYDVVDVWLAQGIPTELTVLVAAGPTQPVPGPELDRLGAWLEGGGRLLALLDPGTRSGLDDPLERWGLRRSLSPLTDPTQNVNGSAEIPRITDYTRHAIVRGFGQAYPTAFPICSPVEDLDPEDDPLVLHEGLARTSKFAIGEGPDGSRTQQRFLVAAAAWKRIGGGAGQTDATSVGSEARIVLVGDSDFVTNQYLPQLSNRNFALNCIGWLSRAQELVSMRSAGQGQTFTLGPEDGPRVFFSVFGAPLLLVVAGLLVFLRRRRL